MSSSDYSRISMKRFPSLRIRDTAETRYWSKFKFPILHSLGGNSAAVPGGAGRQRKRKRSSGGGMAVTSVLFRQGIASGGVPSSSSSSSSWKGKTIGRKGARGESFVATSGLRVFVYDCKTNQPRRTFTRFKDVAYSGCLRHDGGLIGAGDGTGLISVFEMDGSRSRLRSFSGHEPLPVRAVRWSWDGTQLFSGGDDSTVRLWDLSTGSQLLAFSGHTDHVRCAAPSPSHGESVWATGSYDHTVRIWDLRASTSSLSASSSSRPCALAVNHGAPVESVLFLPGGSMLITAGGDEIRAWDILGGGGLLHRWSPHQKTVTSLSLDGTGTRLLSGSLDQHVKVHDISSPTYRLTHSIKYSSPVLSLGLSSDNTRLVVGMLDGSLSIRQRPRSEGGKSGGGGAISAGNGGVTRPGRELVASSSALALAGGVDLDTALSLRLGEESGRVVGDDDLEAEDDGDEEGGSQLTFADAIPSPSSSTSNNSSQKTRNKNRHFLKGQRARPEADAYIVAARRRQRLKPYDRALKQFRYAQALDRALASRQVR